MKTLRALLLILCVGGVAVAQTPNASSTTPAAPTGGQNCLFQHDTSGNFSCYIPTGVYDASGAAASALASAEAYAAGLAPIAAGATPPAAGLLAQYLIIDCTFSAGGNCPDTSGNGYNATMTGTSTTNVGWGAFLNPGSPYTGIGAAQYINLPVADSAGNLVVVNFEPYPGVQDSGTSNYGTQWNQYQAILGSQGATSTDYTIIGGGVIGYAPGEGGFAPEVLYGGGASFKDNTVIPYGGVHTLAFYSGAPNHVWIDGVEQAYASGSQSTTALPSIPNHWSIGGYPGGTGGNNYTFFGTIGMALVYNTSATGTALDSLVKQITSYVNAVVSNRPGFPVQNNSVTGTANILWIGDSIGAGYGAGGTTIQQYLALNNTYTIVNNSLSSVTARTMNPFFQIRNQSYIGQAMNTATATGITSTKCVIALGTNDVENGYKSGSIWGNIVQMGQQCHKYGGQSVLVTQLSRTGQDTNIEAVNLIYRQNWKASGAIDVLADVASNPLLGASGAYANTTYFLGDGTHLTSAGQQLYAAAVSNAINNADGYSSSWQHVVSTGTTYTMTDADAYLQLTNSQTGVTLPPCTGITGQKFYIFSNGITTVSNSSDAAGAIVGSTTIAANTTQAYQAYIYGTSATVGCGWIISQ